jgi:hypothetical protein
VIYRCVHARIKIWSPDADLPSMRGASALSTIVIGGLLLSACGGAAPSAHQGIPVSPTPLISTPTTISTAVDVAWAPVRVAETQAAQLEESEVQYATCYAYAGLNRGLVENTVSTNTPVMETCSTAGLTTAEVQQIQVLIVQAT